MANLKGQSTATKTKAPRRAPAESDTAPVVSSGDAERSAWIADAAYYKAEARGFVPEQALQDWLAAEEEFAARRGH